MRYFKTVMVLLFGGVMTMAGMALAGEDHKALAITHAKAAALSATAGDPGGAAEHAEMAKTHAREAQKAAPDRHLEMALESLDGVVEHGKMGHADLAGNAAAEALVHLRAAP